MTLRHRVAGSIALVVAAALGVVQLTVPGAYGAFSAKMTNSANGVANNPYFTCAAAALGPGAANTFFAYPFGDPNGSTTAADISTNNRPGQYSTVLNSGLPVTVGVAPGAANTGTGAVCPRDAKTVTTLNGSTGYVSGPATTQSSPNVFTEEVWFQTSAKQGRLIGFGSSRTGTSVSYDRHIYIDANGQLEFGVYPNAFRTIATSGSSVADGKWHFAAATLSSAGMALYLDGKLAASDPSTTTGEDASGDRTGTWRIGYDNLTSWPNRPSSDYFNGQLAFAAVYTTALTATQIAAQYAAGR